MVARLVAMNRIAGGVIAVCVAMPAAAQQPDDPASPTPPPNCRTLATAFRTKTLHFTLSTTSFTTTTDCTYDKTSNIVTCTTQRNDKRAKATTVSVMTFDSLADWVDEIKVVPPLRRSTRTETTTTDARGSETTAGLVNSYDVRGRLIKEVTDAPPGGDDFTTTYTLWDSAGRPTAGTSEHRGWREKLSITYDDTKRAKVTTAISQGRRTICKTTFDANGNPTSSSCRGPDGQSGFETKITATERICR